MARFPTNATFACLTADVIDSRSGSAPEAVQGEIRQTLASVNRTFAPALAVPLSITVGDEFQGLFLNPGAAMEAELALRLHLWPRRIRCGLGTGPVAGPFAPRTAEMDGPCFHRSRTALVAARKRDGALTWLVSGDPRADAPVNACLLLLAVLHGRWSDKQVEAVAAFLETGSQTAAAGRLAVSQPSLHRRLRAARAREYLEARELLAGFLDERAGGGGAAP